MDHLISSIKFIYSTRFSKKLQDDAKYHAEGLKNKHFIFYFVGLNKIRHNKKIIYSHTYIQSNFV